MKVTTILSLMAFSAGVMAEAEASPKIKSIKTLCGYKGMTCTKAKRAAEAVAEALASAEPKIKSPLTLCGYYGMTCTKARSIMSEIADAVDSTANTVSARAAEAEPKIKSMKTLCGYPGMTCTKVKRDAVPKIKSIKTLCGYKGMTCTRSEKGLKLVKAENPEIFKDECFQEGSECHAVLAAHAAFQQVKREAEAEPKIKSIKTLCGYMGMTCTRSDSEYKAANIAGHPAAAAAEAECFGPNGDCTVVQRSLDELEATLDKAVADVYKLD